MRCATYSFFCSYINKLRRYDKCNTDCGTLIVARHTNIVLVKRILLLACGGTNQLRIRVKYCKRVLKYEHVHEK